MNKKVIYFINPSSVAYISSQQGFKKIAGADCVTAVICYHHPSSKCMQLLLHVLKTIKCIVNNDEGCIFCIKMWKHYVRKCVPYDFLP